MLVKVALNGRRAPHSHPAVPITAEDCAADAAECVRAGAGAVHLHPRDLHGVETLDPEIIDATVRTVRAAAGVPVGVSTGAWIEPDPARRAKLVAGWHDPDMASVNLGEEGADRVIAALVANGIAVEAGIWCVEDVERLARLRVAASLGRVLVEIVRPSDAPRDEARAIDAALDEAGIRTARLHHGQDAATWPVLEQGVRLGRDIRIGLEDTLELGPGRPAPSNAALVRAAVEIVRAASAS